MPESLPNFLIIGAPKSGTSSLWDHLRAHPQVFLPSTKEISFFDRPYVYARGIDWYQRFFAGAETELAIGEATPTYLFHKDAHPRMARVLPEARLIAILRNPIERAYSHYLHARFYGMERRPFSQAAREETTAPSGELWPFYLAMGRYIDQLQHLFRYYAQSQVLVLLFDDLENDALGAFTAVCHHLGVDDSLVPHHVGTPTNTYREARSESLMRFLTQPRLWERLPRRPRLLAAKMLTRSGAQRPAMDPDIRPALTDFFRESNAALGRWLGRDLSIWC